MTNNRTLLIGVDVGGTNTDSVLIDPNLVDTENKGVLSWNKSVTTKEVSDGINQGINRLFEECKQVNKEEITSVTIGTTHFINAIIEQDEARLSKVAVLRICGPYSRHIPPFSDFPIGLKNIMNGHIGYLKGGFHVDGKPIRSLNEAEILDQISQIKEKGIKSIAIVGIFSSLKADHEIKLKELILKHIPDARVVLSHKISGVGFIERENASILNASILPFAEKIIHSFIDAIENKIGLKCPVFLTQNDGTVLSAYESLDLPIRTFSSGTTNSMRGASFLGNVMGKQAIVVDVGGTTADVGLLLPTGFPRQSSSYCTVGGVRMNFSMPHVESLGLGGGSLVQEIDNEIFVGPESVGYEILERAMVFNGNEITASDVAVAANPSLNIGNIKNVEGKFTNEFISRFQACVKLMLETVIDRMKTSPDDIIVLAVGGGSFILPTDLIGASKVIRPQYYNVANAIGAALGKISSECHQIKQITGDSTKESVLEDLKREAIQKAIDKGALESSIQIIFLSYDPVPYVPNTFEFIVKTVSDVDYNRIRNRIIKVSRSENNSIGTKDIVKHSTFKNLDKNIEINFDTFDYINYIPKINPERQWEISAIDLELLRIGTYILGCGGGGDPYSYFLAALNLLRNGEKITVIDADDIPKYIKGNGDIISVCSAGSPTVSHEQLFGDGLMTCYHTMSRFIRKEPEAIFPVEIGGGNGLVAFTVSSSSKLNIPVVDADLMGRAFPTHNQTIPVVYTPEDEAFYPPTVISNGNGNTMIITESKDDFLLENVMRASLSEIGCSVSLMNPPMSYEDVKEKTINRSISLAWRIGKAVRVARQKSETYKLPEIILNSVDNSGSLLFSGKIIGVERELFKGHVWGKVIIEDELKRKMVIPFKNENIYAKIDDKLVCSVPDLIAVIDSDTGEAVGTPDYRYGLIVFVLGIAPNNKWTDTERGIEIGGPVSFGLDKMEYKPVATFSKPKSVIEEYFK